MLHSFPLLLSLLLSTPPGTTSRPPALVVIIVAADGSGTVRTVQEAFDALPDRSQEWTEIVIRPGRYREKLVLPGSKQKVIIRAEIPGTALLTYDDHTGRVVGADTINTKTSFSCSLEGDDIIVDGVVFANEAGRVGQAVALQITGDRVALYRCALRGDQDTFYARGAGRVYLRECEIEGTTDFIFGSSILLFDRCLIRSKKDSYVTAASTPEGNAYGFVFRECVLASDEGITKVYLGRPWRPFAKTVFLRCELGSHILPAGWHNWSKPDAERTAYYAEYRNSGQGSGRSARVPWSKELTEREGSAYTLDQIFGANGSAAGFAEDWLPEDPPASAAWTPDVGDGMYRNPVINADYSDPDAVRVGDDFYMTASSFACAPGLPILHSRDLVGWRLIGHALPTIPPADSFSVPRYGRGVWAPAIRYHNGEYHIYYADPDNGIFLVKARHPAGPWDPPLCVKPVKGWIDPCPFWDTDGSAYLVHAWSKSRVGFNSILTLNRMNEEGTEILDSGVTVFDGRESQPTIEGPKMYARDGFYYIFAPAGGVRDGWQTVLRSKTPYGPYEARIVMDRGKGPINGPHQGAWVDLPSGSSWFLHFQDRKAYGRVVHLQPMEWREGWPVIGADPDGDGRGEPVLQYRRPTGLPGRIAPESSDEFTTGTPGLQWQWSANPSPGWVAGAPRDGKLRLHPVPLPPGARNLRDAPNLLLQKTPAPAFSAFARCDFRSLTLGGRGGIAVMGKSFATLSVSRHGDEWLLSQTICPKADGGTQERAIETRTLAGPEVVLRIDMAEEARCTFSYALDGVTFRSIGAPFVAQADVWIGAKIGLFALRPAGEPGGEKEYIEVDWFRINPTESPKAQ